MRKCCICGAKIVGYGNNPYPLITVDGDDARCCDDCNSTFVIPARLALLLEDKEDKDAEDYR